MMWNQIGQGSSVIHSVCQTHQQVHSPKTFNGLIHHVMISKLGKSSARMGNVRSPALQNKTYFIKCQTLKGQFTKKI